jgi:hypothetical protein
MYRRQAPAFVAIIVALIALLVGTVVSNHRPRDYDPNSVPRPGDHITFDSTLTPHGYLNRGETPASVVRGEEHRFSLVGSKTETASDPYTHWRFIRKTVCVENRTGSLWWRPAMLGSVVNWRAAGMNAFYREAGQCPSWMPQSQRLVFRVYSKDDGACGKMQPWLLSGRIWKAEVWLNMHGKAGYVACRKTFASQLNLTTHEAGHALGLGHDETQGVMATGLARPYKPSTLDLARVRGLYRLAPL